MTWMKDSNTHVNSEPDFYGKWVKVGVNAICGDCFNSVKGIDGMNKHIEFVKEWLADQSSKTKKELADNYDDAAAAADAAVADAYDAYDAAANAVNAAYWAMRGEAERAAKYVKRHEELTKWLKDSNTHINSEPDFYGKWVSLGDKIPEMHDWYLVAISNVHGKRITVMGFLDGCKESDTGRVWIIDGHDAEEDEIHGWMPLPAPPQPA